MLRGIKLLGFVRDKTCLLKGRNGIFSNEGYISSAMSQEWSTSMGLFSAEVTRNNGYFEICCEISDLCHDMFNELLHSTRSVCIELNVFHPEVLSNTRILVY